MATVDLASRRVTCKVGEVALEADLERPLKAITHVGYAVDNAVADFAPIEIEDR